MYYPFQGLVILRGDKVQSDGSVRKAKEIEVLLSGSVVSTTEETLSIEVLVIVGMIITIIGQNYLV